jgi:hypothetical protein
MREIRATTQHLIDTPCQRCPSQDWILVDGQPSLCARCKHPIPKYRYESDKESHAYYRANDALTNKDFDVALDEFKSYLKSYPNNPNAVMGLLLSQYKISYDFDLKTNQYIPRNHDIELPPNFEREILFKQAMALFKQVGDHDAITHWQRLASQINTTIREFNQFARESSSCEVFISFKHTEQNDKGEWVETPDAAIAEHLYEQLIQIGYSAESIFFSKIDNQHYTGDFEAKIYYKLRTAKLFILVGTSIDHIESPWVKNEWARYYSLMNQGKKHPESMMIVLEDKASYLSNLDSRLKRLNLIDYPSNSFAENFAAIIAKLKEKLGSFSPTLSLVNLDEILEDHEDDIPVDSSTKQVVIDFIDYSVTDIEKAKENEMHLLWERGFKDKVSSIATNLIESYPRNATAYQYLFLIEAHIDSLDELKTTAWLNDQGDLQTFFNYMTSIQELKRREAIEQIIVMTPKAIKEKKPLIYPLLKFLFSTKDLLHDSTILDNLETTLRETAIRFNDLELFDVIMQKNEGKITKELSNVLVQLLIKIPDLEFKDSILKYLYYQLKYEPNFADTFPGETITKRILSHEIQRLVNQKKVVHKSFLLLQKLIQTIKDSSFLLAQFKSIIFYLLKEGAFDLVNSFILTLHELNISPEYVAILKVLSQHQLRSLAELTHYPGKVDEDALYHLKDKILSIGNRHASHMMLSVIEQFEVHKQVELERRTRTLNQSDYLKFFKEFDNKIAIFKPKVFVKIKEKNIDLNENLVASNRFFESIYGEAFQSIYFLETSRLMFKGSYQFKQPYTFYLYPGVIIQDGDFSFTIQTFLKIECTKEMLSDDLILYIRMKSFEKLAPLNDDQSFNAIQLSRLFGIRNVNDLLLKDPNVAFESTLKTAVRLLLLPYENQVKEFLKLHPKQQNELQYLIEIMILNFPLDKESTLFSYLKSPINRSDFALIVKDYSLMKNEFTSRSLVNYIQLIALDPFEKQDEVLILNLIWSLFERNTLMGNQFLKQWFFRHKEIFDSSEYIEKINFFFPKIHDEINAIKNKSQVKKESIKTEEKAGVSQPIPLSVNYKNKEAFLDLLNQSTMAIAKSYFQKLIDAKNANDMDAYLTLGYVLAKGFMYRPSDIEKALDYLEEGCEKGSNACCILFRDIAKEGIIKNKIPKTDMWRERIKGVLDKIK